MTNLPDSNVLVLQLSYLTGVLGLPEKADKKILTDQTEDFRYYDLIFTHKGTTYKTEYLETTDDEVLPHLELYWPSRVGTEEEETFSHIECVPYVKEKPLKKPDVGVKWTEFLDKIKTFKDDYNTKELSLDMRGMATLLMSGAMDSLFDKPLTTQLRLEAIEQLKKAMGSKSELASSKKDEMGIADINNELTRNVWLSKSNPLHKFSLSSFYSSALNSMGFEKAADQGISFTSDQTDIMESFSSMFSDKLFDKYSNQNCRRECAIVAVYKDKSTMTCKNGSKKMNLTFFDGTTDMGLTSWSNRKTGEFEKGLLMRTQEKGVPLLVIGKPSKYMGRNQFTIQTVLALGF